MNNDEFDFGFTTEDSGAVTIEDLKQQLINNAATKVAPQINKEKFINQKKAPKPKKEKIGKRQLKEECFERNETIMNIIYYIGNGILFETQLYKILNFINPNETLKSMKKRVKELQEFGLIRKTQMLNNRNKYSLYLTKYPIARIQNKKTVEVTAVRVTRDKQLFSLFRVERFIQTQLMTNKIQLTDDIKNEIRFK